MLLKKTKCLTFFHSLLVCVVYVVSLVHMWSLRTTYFAAFTLIHHDQDQYFLREICSYINDKTTQIAYLLACCAAPRTEQLLLSYSLLACGWVDTQKLTTHFLHLAVCFFFPGLLLGSRLLCQLNSLVQDFDEVLARLNGLVRLWHLNDVHACVLGLVGRHDAG